MRRDKIAYKFLPATAAQTFSRRIIKKLLPQHSFYLGLIIPLDGLFTVCPSNNDGRSEMVRDQFGRWNGRASLSVIYDVFGVPCRTIRKKEKKPKNLWIKRQFVQSGTAKRYRRRGFEKTFRPALPNEQTMLEVCFRPPPRFFCRLLSRRKIAARFLPELFTLKTKVFVLPPCVQMPRTRASPLFAPGIA